MQASKMPRFFFDIKDGEHFIIDDEGLELDGPEVARDVAVGILPEIARDWLPNGDERLLRSTVRDASGEEIFKVTLFFYCERLK